MKSRLCKSVWSTWLLSLVVLLGGSTLPSYADNQQATVTLTTTKSVGEKIMLQITALKEDVTISGVGADVQWENSRFIWYTVAEPTIVIKGTIKKIKCLAQAFSAVTFDNCTNLQEFDCGDNFFKTLDFRNCPNLEEIYCGGSLETKVLEEINVSGCSELVRIYAPQNALKKLDLQGCSALEVLTCSDNKLETLDLSQATALRELICTNNQLSRLDLTSNKGIKELRCSNNKITELVLTSCPQLKDLSCSDNQMETIDLSKNKVLATFSCSKNNFQKLDLSNNIVLSSLNCSDNQIKDLILNNVTAINEIRCNNNKIKALDLKTITGATLLECRQNLLEDLDISSIIELQFLDCSKNRLKVLDVSANTKLEDLVCSDNELTSLDVQKNKSLRGLSCAGNNIKRLDLSGNKRLANLNCSRNLLSSLDLTSQQALSELICYSNRMKHTAVAKMVEGIRNYPTEFGQKGALYIINGKDSKEANRCLKAHVATLTEKNWQVFDWNSIKEIKDEALQYDGAEPLPTYTVTLKSDNLGTIAIEDDWVELSTVEEGSLLTVLATPKDDKHELKQLLAGGEDITKTMTFRVQSNTEVVAKFGEITSIEEVQESDIILYPNPAVDYVELKAKPFATISIYSIEGLLLFEEMVSEAGTLRIDTRSLSEGIYVILIDGKALRLTISR